MDKNYTEITESISKNMSEFKKTQPDFMQGFFDMSKVVKSDSALTAKEKEFVALGIAIAARCDGCIGFHTKTLVKLGATRAEIDEVLATAVYMGGGPSLMYAADALSAFNEFSGENSES